MIQYSAEEDTLISDFIDGLTPLECGIFLSFLLNNAEDIKNFLKARLKERFKSF